ncbi:MAG: hypothetical protein JWQ36_2255 [Enterovirga sp.]|nr:hypothetical protein [Enterovirga sp.]
MRHVKALETQLSEEACLQALLRLQQGDKPCKACDVRAPHRFVPKHRALACTSCGLSSFPAAGSPFARAQPTLREWFLTIYLVAGQEPVTARDIRRELGVGAHIAELLLSGALQLKAESEAGQDGVDWFDGVREFTEDLAAQPEALRAEPGHAARDRSLAARLADRWQMLAIGGIVALAALGAGIGWMLVPNLPEEDQELAQATAILSLASDKPVLIVSAEVAEQLYDVEDIEADASTASVMPSIRLAPPPGAAKEANVTGAKPLSAPSVKLAPSVGQSLLKGDLSALKGKGGQQRPELAAYNALALELEAKGPRNPDELLTFGPMKIRRHLVEKIIRASRITQVDPVLLMAIADKESSFATEVQAQTSSATGLFQFIERTWLGVVRDFGPAYGLEKEAKLVQTAALPAPERSRILELRRDAYISAVFAAEMLKRDSLRIQKRIGRPLTGGEVYLVHFLGPDGAERLIDRVANAPTLAAAELLPKPAEANKTIFYASAPDGGAKKLSVSEVKDKFETMISLRLERYRNVSGVASADRNANARGPEAPKTR